MRAGGGRDEVTAQPGCPLTHNYAGRPSVEKLVWSRDEAEIYAHSLRQAESPGGGSSVGSDYFVKPQQRL